MIETPIITSTAPVGSGSGNAASSSGGQTAILKLPEGIQKLQPGQVVEARVLGKDTNQHTKLNISNNNVSNELTVSSKIPLQTNSTVLLKILANQIDAQGQTQFRAELVSINGKSPTIPAGLQGDAAQNYTTLRAVLPAVASQSSTTSTNTIAQSTESQNQSVAKGAVLDAVIIKADAKGANLLPQKTDVSAAAAKAYGANQPTQIQPQNQDHVRIHVLSTQTPSTQAPTTPPTQPASQSNYNAYQGGQGVSSPNAATTTTPNNAVTSQEALSAFAARSTSAPTSTGLIPLSTNGTFTGTVIGSERSGETVVSTPLGTIKLATSSPLPQGSVLTLEVLSHQTKTEALTLQTAAKVITSGNYKLSLTGTDSAFEQAFSALQAMEKETGKSLIRDTFPNTQNQAAAKLLWFIFNTQGGTAAQWLGQETTNQLNKSQHKDILKKLEAAFSQNRSLFSEPNEAGWHTLVFPFSDGENLQFGRFYTRTNQEDGDKQGDIRFLVEVDFDNLGDVQLDGLIHDTKSVSQANKKFDLYVRSRKPIDNDMKHHIIKLFDTSIQTTGLKGNIIIQTVDEFPVHPDTSSHDEGEIIA